MQAPTRFTTSIVEVPCKNAQYIIIAHSNVENKILAVANELDENDNAAGKRLCIELQYLPIKQPPVLTEVRRSELEAQLLPKCMLTQGAIAYESGFMTPNPRIFLRGPDGERDITPSGLAEHAAVPGRRRLTFDCLDASQKVLITELDRGVQSKYFVGADSLRLIAGIDTIRTLGEGYDARGYHRYALTELDKVLEIDADQAAVVERTELGWIRAIVEQVYAAGSVNINDFAVANDILAIRTKDFIRFYSKSGGSYTIQTFSLVNVSPSGNPRGDYFSQRIIREPHSLVLEGKHTGIDKASDRAVLVPLNSTTIGVLDRDYYRMVIFQAK